MLQTLIRIERERFAKMGYDSVVTTEEIVIDNNPNFTKSLGNDTVIVTGLLYDSDSVQGENPRICITSANDALCASVFNFASYGTSVLKTMRQYLEVCRYSKTYNEDFTMTLQVVKITPKLRS